MRWVEIEVIMMQRCKLNISSMLLIALTLGFSFACDAVDSGGEDFRRSDSDPGKGGKSGKQSGDASVGIAGDGDGGGGLACDGKIYACGDTLDNDGDGLVDYADPECTTPCDHDEGSFQTDLAGQNEDCKADCYFDDNTGFGDDQCQQNLQCDAENPGALIGCEYDSELGEKTCEIVDDEACQVACEPLVPNGCDCFGCCQIGEQFVYLDGSPNCSLGNLAECQSCTWNDDCANACEEDSCEFCFGQTVADLPDECNGVPACPEGVSPCGGHGDCGAGQFCQTGCCISFN